MGLISGLTDELRDSLGAEAGGGGRRGLRELGGGEGKGREETGEGGRKRWQESQIPWVAAGGILGNILTLDRLK